MMSRGRRRLEWAQTSDLLALLFNGFFRPQDARRGDEFNPTIDDTTEAEDVPQVPLSFLRHVFVGR